MRDFSSAASSPASPYFCLVFSRCNLEDGVRESKKLVGKGISNGVCVCISLYIIVAFEVLI